MASLIEGESFSLPLRSLDHLSLTICSGITSFAEAANAVQVAYGFGYDLSVFLSALGLIAGGDLPTGKYTIGGRKYPTLGPISSNR